MAKPKDYYEVLGVDRKATADQIRKAYRKLARQYHPDVNKAADAAAKFNEIQQAYDVLADEEKRKTYDRFGHAGVGAGAGAGGQPGAGWNARPGQGGRTVYTNINFDPEDLEAGDLGSMFEQMFGGAAGARGRAGGSPFGGFGTRAAGAGAGARTRTQPQRGQDIEHTITIAFMTAALGGTEQIKFSGDGAASTINVKIPVGIESGAKLRVKGKGQPSPTGGESGDMILIVRVGKHPYFRREGLDLLIDVPITIAEAALGTTVTVPLLAGSAGADASGGLVKLKVPPGVSSGRKLRVKGKGITDAKGHSGDFHAVVQIVAPPGESLSDKGRACLAELATELINPRESAPWADDVREPKA